MSKLAPRQPNQTIQKKVTTRTFHQKKELGEPITMLTGYDYPSALAMDLVGIDGILVGDSLGMVILGYENTLPVTLEDMLHHCRAVVRAAKSALLIGDMPFLTYQVSTEEAVRNAGCLIQQGGMEAVKLEGGREQLPAIRAILAAGIPVMGHLGLTPQSVNLLGGFRPQGKTAAAGLRILEDALLLEDAGCFSLVLESIPARLAELISKRLSIPTIGIGAGSHCDGQVLVMHDMLGYYDRLTPKFVRKYANLHSVIQDAFSAYISEVKNRSFPAPEHTIDIPDDEWEALIKILNSDGSTSS